MEELKWEPFNVLAKDKPCYRIVEVKKKDGRTELCIVRSIEGEKILLNLRCMEFPYVDGIFSLDYKLVGSDVGVLCFHMPIEKKFKLWNPIASKTFSTDQPCQTVLAYSFFKQPASPDNMNIVVFGANSAEGAVSLYLYSTYTRKWDLLVSSVNARESKIRGPGMLADGVVYWPCYTLRGRMESLVIFDCYASKLFLEPLHAVDYDFIGTLMKLCFVDGKQYLICLRKVEVEVNNGESGVIEGEVTKEMVGVSDILCLTDSGEAEWTKICTSAPKTVFLDVLGSSRYLLRCEDDLRIVSNELNVLAKFPFDNDLSCSLSLVFAPDFNNSFLTVEAKPPSNTPVKRVISGIRSGIGNISRRRH